MTNELLLHLTVRNSFTWQWMTYSLVILNEKSIILENVMTNLIVRLLNFFQHNIPADAIQKNEIGWNPGFGDLRSSA